MQRHDCPHLPDVLAATAECRERTATLAAHLAACPSCREQAEAAAFVSRLADTSDAPHPLPDPAVIWWKGQLLRRWQADQAAAAPIERMHWVELAAGIASLAAFLVWQGKALAAAAAAVVSKSLVSAAAAPSPGDPAGPALVGIAAILAAGMFLAVLHRRLGGHHA